VPDGIAHHQWVLCQPHWVGADKVHSHVLSTGPLDEEDVCWPPASQTFCLFLHCNAVPDAHLVEGVPEGIVSLRAPVLLTTDKVVTKRVN
jgi:hypothetical protein